MLPAEGMELGPGEVFEARPVGVLRVIEEAERADHDVRLETLASVEVDGVGLGPLVPHGVADGGVETEVGPQSEVVEHLFEIGLQLGLLGVGPGPVVGLERVGVEMRSHVDLGPRVTVVPPGTAGPGGLLEDGEGMNARLLELDRRGNAGEAGPDDGDLGGACRPKVFRCPASFHASPGPARTVSVPNSDCYAAERDPSARRIWSTASCSAVMPVGMNAPMVRNPCIWPS